MSLATCKKWYDLCIQRGRENEAAGWMKRIKAKEALRDKKKGIKPEPVAPPEVKPTKKSSKKSK